MSRSVIEIVNLHSHAAAPLAERRHVILPYESYDAFIMFPNSSWPTSGVALSEKPLLGCGQSARPATQSAPGKEFLRPRTHFICGTVVIPRESARLGDGEQDTPRLTLSTSERRGEYHQRHRPQAER